MPSANAREQFGPYHYRGSDRTEADLEERKRLAGGDSGEQI